MGSIGELLRFGAEGWGDEMLRGTAMTLAIALGAFSLGTVFGAAGAAAKLNGGRLAAGLADLYTTVARGVPELLVIYLLFFGGSHAITALAGIFGYNESLDLDAFTIGVVSVGLVSGAYSTEVLRGAVQAVPRGQMEAARALGMPPGLRVRRILIPQTLRYALPGLGNVWQATLKDTALVSVTALAEIMRQASVAAGSTRSPFLFYGLAAVLYLLLSSLSTTAFAWGERHLARGQSRS